MGKNSDHKNIFESYYNNVVLNEATTDLSKLDDRNLEALLKTQTNAAAIKSIEAEIAKRKSAPSAQQPAQFYKGGGEDDNSTIPSDFGADLTDPNSVSLGAQPSDQYAQTVNLANNPSSVSLGGSVQPAQSSQYQSANLTDPNSVSLNGQSVNAPSKPTSNFQKKLDADYDKFKNGKQATRQTTSQPKAQSSGGGSIVDYLASSGKKSDFASRSKMAADYGIQNYKGTAEQNTQLLNKLKSGEKPAQQAAATQAEPKKQQGMGGIVGGASKAVGSVGQGLKQATIGTKKPLGGVLGGISKAVGSAGKGIKKALVGDQDESEEEGFVQFENNNISKFLKSLSEKDYSRANKYLKTIVDNKINRNVLKNINNK